MSGQLAGGINNNHRSQHTITFLHHSTHTTPNAVCIPESVIWSYTTAVFPVVLFVQQQTLVNGSGNARVTTDHSSTHTCT